VHPRPRLADYGSPAAKFKPIVNRAAVVAAEKRGKGGTERGRRVRMKVKVSGSDICSAQAS
jgi:hypothetical protein